MDFYQVWRSGKVNRMHVMPQLIRENIAEHTWGILLAIVRYWPECPQHILVAIILHDCGEMATGDIPAHIKWSSPDLQKILEEKEAAWLKRAELKFPTLTLEEQSFLTVFDKLDFCMSCIHEMRMGNLNAARYFKRSFTKAQELTYNDLPSGEMQQIAGKFLIDVHMLLAEYCPHVPEGEFTNDR